MYQVKAGESCAEWMDRIIGQELQRLLSHAGAGQTPLELSFNMIEIFCITFVWIYDFYRFSEHVCVWNCSE